LRGFALCVLALLIVGGCSDKKSSETGETTDRPTVVVTAQPQDPQAARVAVEQAFSLLSGGDWAGVWELWTTEAQNQVAKDTYVNLISTCPEQGKSYQITDVKSVDATTATVTWKREKPAGGTEDGATTVRYQSGTWRVEPDPAALAAYKRGACS
jgi:hypothetical protein